ncbi:polyhydroxyalkanoate depolymerase [Lichenibacterium dinghuense]|uniref:polyhydroxyalkanoate depolymerase n=1 Tax=Lichenibacterium dinghuense TaxID=2895977 RepID=UPI001F3DE93B|nr:polyhydroxyalkanoate depolymerase [Lichenibacterium sp. 6Y81]
MKVTYPMYEMMHLALAPSRALSDYTRLLFKNPLNPWTYTPVGRNIAASAELFERMTRRYGKPVFGLDHTTVDGRTLAVTETPVWERPFCKLLHFKKHDDGGAAPRSRMLVVAPLSGHYATLLRGTVDALLPHFDVYVTDWADARMVPLAMGKFDLDDYIGYLIDILRVLGGEGVPVHTLGVCQPAVPLIIAAAHMEKTGDPLHPTSMTLMGGPIDTRCSPTAVNQLAVERGTEWFRENCLETVPFPYPGMGREVYPGYLQLSGFMAMNMDRHVGAHQDMFYHLVNGDGDSAEKHRDFYDEYMAVLDLTAEYYMQTIEQVFVRQSLPKGEFVYAGDRIDLGDIRRTALMTVEGEKDDISGVGQTNAAQRLCRNLPDALKLHYLQPGVGHYGVFNGSRYRKEIVPRMVEFARRVERAGETSTVIPLRSRAV